MSDRCAPCECELEGAFYTGVPGILAEMHEGRVAPESVVERCDLCRRYPSDAVAWAKLRELGLTGCQSTKDDQPPSFTVQCYAVVRVEFAEVVADDPQSAASRVLDRFDWDVHGRDAQLAKSDLIVLMNNGGLDQQPTFQLTQLEVEP